MPGCDQLVNSPVSLATAKGWGATCFRWDRNLPDLDRKLNWTRARRAEGGGQQPVVHGFQDLGVALVPWRPQSPGPWPLPPELFFLTWPDSVSPGECTFRGEGPLSWSRVGGRDQDQILVDPWPDPGQCPHFKTGFCNSSPRPLESKWGFFRVYCHGSFHSGATSLVITTPYFLFPP